MKVEGWLFLGCAAFFGGSDIVYWHFSHDLPKIITMADYRPPIVTKILAAPDPANPKDEQLIGEFYAKERRYVVPYEKIPEVVVRAFILIRIQPRDAGWP